MGSGSVSKYLCIWKPNRIKSDKINNKINDSITQEDSNNHSRVNNYSNPTMINSNNSINQFDSRVCFNLSESSENVKKSTNKRLNNIIDEILPSVRAILMKNNEENPVNIIKLQQIARDESLWLNILFRLIDKIEIDDQLGPSIISIFLEETPLPSKEQIKLLTNKITLNEKVYSEKIQRNILVILSCLSEKIAGTNIASYLAEKTVDFIFNCLSYGCNINNNDDSLMTIKEKNNLNILLFALISLEKFSMSSQNKFSIMNKLNTNENKLILLSRWHKNNNYLKHQIGFLALYLLDNIFTPDNYEYGYTRSDYINTNVRLNDEDTSENLKISPSGLEARNDTLSFESVRSTIQVDEGVWFYEVTLLTNGIMQIGFATKSVSFLNHQGFGIGDDQYSVGFDGCRNLIWYNAECHMTNQISWKEGDIIGFLLNIDEKKICFYHNGQLIKPIHTELFNKCTKGIFPAASFMSFQHVLFNFGKQPFKYPPLDCNFKNFNTFGLLDDEKKYVLPKRKKLEILRKSEIKEDACSICCENFSNSILIPCNHKNFCEDCVKKLKNCPMCRTQIQRYELIESSQ